MEIRQKAEILNHVDNIIINCHTCPNNNNSNTRRFIKWHTDGEVEGSDQEVVFGQDAVVVGVTSQDTVDVVAVGCEIKIFTCGVKL